MLLCSQELLPRLLIIGMHVLSHQGNLVCTQVDVMNCHILALIEVYGTRCIDRWIDVHTVQGMCWWSWFACGLCL